MKRVLAGVLIVVASLCLLSAPCVFAQDLCEGNFDCDEDVDGSDAMLFKTDFGRSAFFEPCPPYNEPFPCNPCPYGMIDCGTKCVDPLTDGDFCGVDSACLGGVVCGTTDRCIAGICEDVGGGGGYQAAVEKTGQTTSFATGDDGDLEEGVVWPNPRFTDNSDGTVTDNLTGLIWLKEANCFGQRTWSNALSDASGLSNGSCGLTDGSSPGDWRLPNKNELASLVHNEYYRPALPNTAGTGQWSAGDPFTNVQSSYYWSSSTYAVTTNAAWSVYMDFGSVEGIFKSHITYVWPVRGPE
jgi:hypothetical protein